MGKIHELLAVEGDVKAKAQKATSETKALFAQPTLFTGQVRTYEPLDENGDKFPPEVKVLGAHAWNQMRKAREDFGHYVDLVVSKEVSNSSATAKSSVVVNGKEILPALPVTALLNLESRLAELKEVYAAIPTNDLTEEWETDQANDLWRSKPSRSYRTKKVAEKVVLYEATKEHPAQVQMVQVDVREGTWTTIKTSSMFSPTQKAERLGRIEILLMAVRQARQRANDVEAADTKVAESIFKFVEGG